MTTKKPKTVKPVIGRPSKFTKELADKICECLANGDSLRKICASGGMPAASTVWLWLSENKAFSEQYARAREKQAEFYADEIVEIADSVIASSDEVLKARLQIDARKWHASKLAPKKYGDKVTQDVNHSGHVATTDVPLDDYKAAREQVLKDY